MFYLIEKRKKFSPLQTQQEEPCLRCSTNHPATFCRPRWSFLASRTKHVLLKNKTIVDLSFMLLYYQCKSCKFGSLNVYQYATHKNASYQTQKRIKKTTFNISACPETIGGFSCFAFTLGGSFITATCLLSFTLPTSFCVFPHLLKTTRNSPRITSPLSSDFKV